jgi:hypothetical protein
MRLLLATLAVVLFALVAPLPASAQEMDDCPHTATIESLRTCVQHAADHGHIDNPGVVQSLIAKLNTAEAALDRRQDAVAINMLKAFVRELNAQSGKHIAVEHATHLRMHAEHVIASLSG